MFLIKIIPLFKIPFPGPQILSYFSKEKIAKGVLVKIPFRKKLALGCVLESKPLQESKIEVKKSSFLVKPIKSLLSKYPLLSEEQIELAAFISQKNIAPFGLTLKRFLPKAFFKEKTLASFPSFKNRENRNPRFLPPLLVWRKERHFFYLKFIKKFLKKDRTKILFLVPEKEKVYFWLNFFKKELPFLEVSVFLKDLKKQEELQIWQKVNANDFQVILGAKSALLLPWRQLNLIIVDEEENPAFEEWGQEPRYNAKEVAFELSRQFGARLIFGSNFPSLQTYWYFKKNHYPFFKGTQENKINIQIIDLRQEESFKEKSQVFSVPLKKEIEKTLQEKGRIIIFFNRKGFAPVLLCQDCGFVKKCPNCDLPFTYHLEEKNSFLLCHHCARKEEVSSLCDNCQSFNLKLIGKGAQKVFQECRFSWPSSKILRLDTDFAQSEKKQKEVVLDFLKNESAILIMTKLGLKFDHLFQKTKINLLAIISLDQMLNFPDFRIQERVFQNLQKFTYFSEKMIIQTFNPTLPLLDFLKKGAKEEFLKEELKHRQDFQYPPFSELIRIQFRHQKSEFAYQKLAKIKKELLSFSSKNQIIFGPLPYFLPKIKNKYLWQILIKCLKDSSEFKEKLMGLDLAGFKIEVNPEESF